LNHQKGDVVELYEVEVSLNFYKNVEFYLFRAQDSDSEHEQIDYNTYISDEEIGKRPLSKLIKDISKELGLLNN
jgi:hypothetical protein